MKTERLVILVTPAQKRAIAHRAKSLDVSVAELLRRSAAEYAKGADEAMLALLALLAGQMQLGRSRRQRRVA